MKLKKVESGVKKKPKLKKIVKPIPLNVPKIITPNLTCEWRNNFPWKPIMKEYEIITNLPELKWLVDKMKSIPAFAFDTETNTL